LIFDRLNLMGSECLYDVLVVCCGYHADLGANVLFFRIARFRNLQILIFVLGTMHPQCYALATRDTLWVPSTRNSYLASAITHLPHRRYMSSVLSPISLLVCVSLVGLAKKD
jgi:hypothetical protein